MKRLIFSAIGVALTFIWIVYTAPPIQGKNSASDNVQIKTINKSGSGSVMKQSVYKTFKPDTNNIRKTLLVSSTSEVFIMNRP